MRSLTQAELQVQHFHVLHPQIFQVPCLQLKLVTDKPPIISPFFLFFCTVTQGYFHNALSETSHIALCLASTLSSGTMTLKKPTVSLIIFYEA